MVSRWRLGLLGVLVSLLAIYFIVRQIDVYQFGLDLARARYIYVLPTAALLLAGLVTRAIRWRILLSEGLPIGRAFSIMNVAYMVNGILPLRVGELARAYLATRANPPVPVFKSASTILVERLLDLLAVLVLLALALLAGPVPNELRAAGVLAAPTGIAGFLLLVFLSRQRTLVETLLEWFIAHIPLLERLNLRAWLAHFLDGLLPLAKPRTLLQALAWTGVSWWLSVVAGYVLMFAFFERADWAVTCLYITAAAFAIAVPAVPGNIGTYELSILLALNALGYGEPASTAGAFAVVVHGVNLLVHALTGTAGFIQEGVTLAQLSQGIQGIRQHTNVGSS